MLIRNENFINLTRNIINFYAYIENFISKISSHTYLFFSIKERSIFVIVLCVQFIPNTKIEIVLFSGYRMREIAKNGASLKRCERVSLKTISFKKLLRDRYEGTTV